MKCMVTMMLAVLVATTPAFARGHGSTAPMCSTCAHRTLCRFDELFSCDRSKLPVRHAAMPEEGQRLMPAATTPADDKTQGGEH